MEIENKQDAHDKIADVVWWLKGFRAAQNNEYDSNGINHMISGLQNVQDFLRAEEKDNANS